MSAIQPPAVTYLNPVYRRACPDPFALRHCGEYWCYFTGLRPDGRCFGILHSLDLVNWEEVGSAMDPLPGGHIHYWAPEVVYDNGRFYLYYSVGDEENMQIRVAVAGQPQGPFVDSGRTLTTEKFAIDPHVFVDDDGGRYLFYATDFLDYTRIGTGIVYDHVLDPFLLAGKPRPATRARYDWQIYDPQRASKGGVCWHTVEGPFVLKHGGRYYEMFSGGNWQNQSYGVSYAVTGDPASPDEWEQACDDERTLPILRSLPELGVVGPGHNSVVRGPDNCELYCIYHRWDPGVGDRVLAIDRMRWEGERLRVDGPSTTPQPAPAQPALAGFGGFTFGAGRWHLHEDGAALSAGEEEGEGAVLLPRGDLVLELSITFTGLARQGEVKVAVGTDGAVLSSWSLDSGRIEVQAGSGPLESQALSPAFDPGAFHLLRLELRGDQVLWLFDPPAGLRASGEIARPADALWLTIRGLSVSLRGLAITAC